MEMLDHFSFNDGNIDSVLTSGNLLYLHAVRLASVNLVKETTITTLRTVVDLLAEMEESEVNFSLQPDVE